jgi:2-haloalkanoic acid dehalogenase type II
MLKGIFFDCYGTIISTGNGSVEATREILEKIGVSIYPETFYKHWKKIHKENISKLKEFKKEKDIFIDDLKLLYEYYKIESNVENDVIIMLNSLYKRAFYDDSLYCINKLKKKYKIYIASNSDTEPLLENVGENKFIFDGIFTSEDLIAYKPSIQFFNKIMTITELKSNEIIYIGDSLNDDILGAKNVGIYTILIDRKNEYKKNNIKPDAIINNLYNLEEILNEINKVSGHFA